MWGWQEANWVTWLLMSVMMLAFWGGLIALVVWLMRGSSGPSDRRSDAESILEERFARGEIDVQELETRRKALRANGGTRAA
jgi:putative membrane protein